MNTVPLERVALLRSASALAKKQLMDCAVFERYHRGDRLFGQDEKAQFIWFVLQGWVHLMRDEAGPDGRQEVALFTITPAESLCGVSGIAPGTYTATAVAGGDVEALRVPTAVMRLLLKSEPTLAYEALRLCAERLRHMAEHCGKMSQPVRQRILHIILRLNAQFGARIPITHRELAQLAWTTTETAIRTVRQLKREGLLEGGRGVLTANRPEALRKELLDFQTHRGASNGHAASGLHPGR